VGRRHLRRAAAATNGILDVSASLLNRDKPRRDLFSAASKGVIFQFTRVIVASTKTSSGT